jgi:predicted O-linked N-acetylglucosamine transferase (SPINDLY family)
VDESRLVFRAIRGRLETLYRDIDIALDTFPQTGGTTTCEALWMGVPTLTLNGETMLARQGAALLSAGGLPDWVATDRAEFVAKAVAFASDIPGLSHLRSTLRERIRTSPLFDTRLFARRFEEALHGIWQEQTSARFTSST